MWQIRLKVITKTNNICSHLSNRKPSRLLPPVTFPSLICSTTHINCTHTGNLKRGIFSVALILPIKPQPLYLKSYHINYMSMSYSYLGNGLYAARLATLGALGAEGRISGTFCPLRFVLCAWQIMANSFLVLFCPGLDQKIFSSSCLPKKFREDVTFGGTTYKVSGIPDGKISTLRF